MARLFAPKEDKISLDLAILTQSSITSSETVLGSKLTKKAHSLFLNLVMIIVNSKGWDIWYDRAVATSVYLIISYTLSVALFVSLIATF